jgi:recombination protein RecA
MSKSKTSVVFINQLREKVGVIYGSPETTSGGKALKFYATIRLDVRKADTIKSGTETVGNKTRVKVIKNKLASPFKQVEFDIIFGKGISATGCLLNLGVENGLIDKAGSWFSYKDERIGQGRERAIEYLDANPALKEEIEKTVRSIYNLN